MSQIPLPDDQQKQFEKVCHARGLNPQGFDISAYKNDDTSDPFDIVVRIAGREYRYPIAAGDDESWVSRFFDDLNADTHRV